jgi:hypothetical protein
MHRLGESARKQHDICKGILRGTQFGRREESVLADGTSWRGKSYRNSKKPEIRNKSSLNFFRIRIRTAFAPTSDGTVPVTLVSNRLKNVRDRKRRLSKEGWRSETVYQNKINAAISKGLTYTSSGIAPVIAVDSKPGQSRTTVSQSQ